MVKSYEYDGKKYKLSLPLQLGDVIKVVEESNCSESKGMLLDYIIYRMNNRGSSSGLGNISPIGYVSFEWLDKWCDSEKGKIIDFLVKNGIMVPEDIDVTKECDLMYQYVDTEGACIEITLDGKCIALVGFGGDFYMLDKGYKIVQGTTGSFVKNFRVLKIA